MRLVLNSKNNEATIVQVSVSKSWELWPWCKTIIHASYTSKEGALRLKNRQIRSALYIRLPQDCLQMPKINTLNQIP